jgi:hypothetical protein
MTTTRLIPPARAILWEYLARYPLLDFAIVAELTAMIALAHLLPESWRAAAVDQGQPWTIFPVMMFFFGIIILFSVNTTRPRSAPCGHPARMFLYPMSTARLVAWPMLFGAVAMALGWVAVAMLVLPGFGIHMPLGRGALAAAAALACLQALSWWPFGTSLAMVLAVSIIPTALITLVLWPMYIWEWGPGSAWVLLSVYPVAAYAVAWRGVTLDRRGDGRGGRGWLTAFDGIDRLVEIIPGARSRFASAARAQLWLEWRSKGAAMFVISSALTLVTAFFIALVTLLDEKRSLTPMFLGWLLAGPLLICATTAAIFAKDEMSSRTAGMSPFLATRPLPSATLAGAKLGGAALLLVVSCGFALAVAALWALAIGRLGTIASGFASLARERGAVVVFLVATLGPALVLVLSWKGMVGAMLPVLTGRQWVTNAIGAAFTTAMILVVVAVLLFAPRLGAVFVEAKLILAGKAPPPRFLFAAMPTALGLMLGLKLALSGLAFRAAIVRGLISHREAIGPVLLWVAATASLMTLAALLFRPSSLTQWLTLAMVSALVPPLGRTPTATLALDWGRHR